MTKPDLLYITPVVPSPTGNGLAMRAYNVLEALSSKYRCHLLIVSMRRGGRPKSMPHLEFCREIVFAPRERGKDFRLALQHLVYKISPALFYRIFGKPSEWASLSVQRIKSVRALFPRAHFDVIHVFRLYMAPFAEAFVRGSSAGSWQIDLDDIESLTRRRLSGLYRLNGDKKNAAAMECEGRLYESIERRTLPGFDRIFVCSEPDGEKIGRMYQCARVEVIPNVVHIPAVPPLTRVSGTFSFLFVGTLRYYPNYDGIVYFCETILPLIRKKMTKRFVVKVAGVEISEELAGRLSTVPEVELVGYVEDLAPVYEAAHAVIVPVRGGGGTRIKVLEAFSYRRPVVSTSAGIEGIRAKNGKHVLVGDTPEEFARHCEKIMMDPELRDRLADEAFILIKTCYSPEILRKII